MDFVLIDVSGDSLELAEETGKREGFIMPDETLESAHKRVRGMWPFPSVDTSKKSRLAWRKGDKIVTYTYGREDVLILMPNAIAQLR
jgi:hypothetical protein